MPDIGIVDHATRLRAAGAARRRAVLLAIVGAAGLAGALWTGHQAASAASADAGVALTRLLRAMAAMKAMVAAGLVAVAVWRLQMPASRGRLAAYALACAAMAAGPGLIWSMAHVRLGALFLHAGLFAGVVMLWRDPATAALLKRKASGHS